MAHALGHNSPASSKLKQAPLSPQGGADVGRQGRAWLKLPSSPLLEAAAVALGRPTSRLHNVGCPSSQLSSHFVLLPLPSLTNCQFCRLLVCLLPVPPIPFLHDPLREQAIADRPVSISTPYIPSKYHYTHLDAARSPPPNCCDQHPHCSNLTADTATQDAGVPALSRAEGPRERCRIPWKETRPSGS